MPKDGEQKSSMRGEKTIWRKTEILTMGKVGGFPNHQGKVRAADVDKRRGE